MNTNKKLVGAAVPQPLVDYLNLYSMACETSKSDILRSVLIKWYDERRVVLSKNVLIQNLTAKYQQQWLIFKLDNANLDNTDCRELAAEFSFFKKSISKTLKKKLNEAVVDDIIDNLVL